MDGLPLIRICETVFLFVLTMVSLADVPTWSLHVHFNPDVHPPVRHGVIEGEDSRLTTPSTTSLDDSLVLYRP